MKSQRNNKINSTTIGLGLLIFISALIIFIVVPAWQSMSRNGNESNAAHLISSIQKMQNKYASTHQGRFAPNFDELIKFRDLDEGLRGEKPIVNGYVFEMKVEESDGTKPAFYSINADPQVAEGLFSTGTSHFYFDSTLRVIKSTEESRQAKADDPSI